MFLNTTNIWDRPSTLCELYTIQHQQTSPNINKRPQTSLLTHVCMSGHYTVRALAMAGDNFECHVKCIGNTTDLC